METVLLICAIAVTLAIVVAVVFLVRVLLQVNRVTKEVEVLLKNVNKEVDTIVEITDILSALVARMSSPWVKAGSWATGFVSTLLKSRKDAKKNRQCV